MNKNRKNYDFSYDDNLINLTPLIDVVFVVLVAFILIAPLLESDHVNLAQSSTKSTKAVENSKVIIKVDKKNNIYIDNKLVSSDSLTNFLIQKKNLFPNSTPQLYHDKEASFGTYQIIKNSLETVGFENIDIILKPN